MSDIARHKMLKARSELVLDHPFFASLALRLDMREDPSCATAWSDGRVLAYNPGYIEALPLNKVKGLQCHEVLHLACHHHTRRGDRDLATWNRACDYAINPILLEAGVELPTGFLDDPAFAGKGAEKIYAALVEHEEVKEGADNGPQELSTDGEQMEALGAGSAGRKGQGEDSRSQGQDGDVEEDGSAAEQGAAGERSDAPTDNEGHGDPGMSGEVRDAPTDAPGTDAATALQLEEQSWEVALAQAVNKARECGEVPGGLQRLVERLLSPNLSWREMLRRFLSDAARNDFSWVRPNRRLLHAGLYLPGLDSEQLASVAVAVDVSGSITQAELDSFATELSAVLEEFDATLTLFTCDAVVTAREELGRWDLPLDFSATGGGGTDFRPPFAALREDGADPACFIYFTDLECPHYPDDPGYPVLWITPNQNPVTPPFGEVITMDEHP